MQSKVVGTGVTQYRISYGLYHIWHHLRWSDFAVILFNLLSNLSIYLSQCCWKMQDLLMRIWMEFTLENKTMTERIARMFNPQEWF
jgi:hypothetical protein